jgi:hypothetical protein
VAATDTALDLLADWANRRDGGAPDVADDARYWWSADVPFGLRRFRRSDHWRRWDSPGVPVLGLSLDEQAAAAAWFGPGIRS